jgi:hypothetical protein
MEWFVRAFLESSLAWLALGVSLGVAMAVHPSLTLGASLFAWIIWRTIDGHTAPRDADERARSAMTARTRAPLPNHPVGAA